MEPREYLDYLSECAEHDHLPPSNLRPCSLVDVSSVEHEVKKHLPSAYVDFLCQVGVGEEHGGLGKWFHLDVSHHGNILEIAEEIAEEQREAKKVVSARHHKGFLPVYDSCDGAIYGFMPNGNSTHYQPTVFCWDTDSFVLERVSDTFFDFLSYLAEVDEEDISHPTF